MNEQIESMQGQLIALNSVLCSLMATLAPIDAAHMAADLAIEQEVQNMSDEEQETPAAESRSRNAVLSGYVELLQSAASRD